MKTRSYIFIGLVIIILAAVLIAAQAQSSSSTTIGGNISTSGTLTVNGNTSLGDAAGTDTVTMTAAPTITLAADKKITIDAATTDQTQTSGALDINIDSA